MKVGDLVKILTVTEQPLGIITKVVQAVGHKTGVKKYYVLLSDYDVIGEYLRPFGPFPFLGSQLEGISESG